MNTKTERLKHAELARWQENWLGALTELDHVLANYGRDANVLRLKAQIENRLYQLHIVDEPERAELYKGLSLQHISEAIALEPTNARHNLVLGHILEFAVPPNPQAALDAFRRAIQIEPLCWDALASVVFLHDHPDADLDQQEAIRYGELALRIRPTRSLWLIMAELYKSTGQAAESERARVAGLTETQE